MKRTELRASLEARLAKDIQRQAPGTSWGEALRIAARWVDQNPLTDTNTPKRPAHLAPYNSQPFKAGR